MEGVGKPQDKSGDVGCIIVLKFCRKLGPKRRQTQSKSTSTAVCAVFQLPCHYCLSEQGIYTFTMTHFHPYDNNYCCQILVNFTPQNRILVKENIAFYVHCILVISLG